MLGGTEGATCTILRAGQSHSAELPLVKRVLRAPQIPAASEANDGPFQPKPASPISVCWLLRAQGFQHRSQSPSQSHGINIPRPTSHFWGAGAQPKRERWCKPAPNICSGEHDIFITVFVQGSLSSSERLMVFLFLSLCVVNPKAVCFGR